jgi:undecaprenyl-phosphate 4-deoxy-4-formamido-L-arabinose transferase
MQSPEPVSVSVVVPMYNEAATLNELVHRIGTTLRKRDTTFEVILVNDGSTDSTQEILERLSASQRWIRILCLPQKSGQAAALCHGIFTAQGEVVVTMDGDLQNPPEEIPQLLDAMSHEVDLVTARRAERHDEAWRWLGSRLVHWMARLLVGSTINDFGGQFKAYRHEVIDITRAAWSPGKPFFALAVWLGFRVVEVSVRHDPRKVGASRYDFASLVRLNFEIMRSFTPPAVAVLATLSAACLVIGSVSWLWRLCAERSGDAARLVPAILLITGVVLAVAVVLGIHLARLLRHRHGAFARRLASSAELRGR